MATLNVGPGEQYSTISSAVAAAHNGDTIDVAAGTYTNDFVDTGLNLTLQAVGGAVNMVATESPPDDKGIITEGSSGGSFTINGFTISGATSGSGNGAGIRFQGGTLNLNDDTIKNSQMGLLADPDPNGSITINNSEFADNGTGDGTTHNVYAGQINQLTVENSYIHDANGGHEIKSRAANTTIENNRILDPGGQDSYSIDIPQGGNATITGNTIEQSAPGQNPAMIAYGEEGNAYGFNGGSSVNISGNTLDNEGISNGTGVWNATSTAIQMSNNQVYGLTPSSLEWGGPMNQSGTNYMTGSGSSGSSLSNGNGSGSSSALSTMFHGH
jgi:hypothetical protein